MTVHMVKLCVGADSIQDLKDWQNTVMARRGAMGLSDLPVHETRMMPKRAEDLTNGGSIYWVVKGNILVRQRILYVNAELDRSGRKYCELVLDRKLFPTSPTPRKAFQGWRYLEPKDAPADLDGTSGSDLPANLSAELRNAGVW